MPDDLPTLFFASAADWEAWLDAHHADSRGVWIKVAKKNSGIASITTGEALELALCFGWIDSQRDTLDDEYFLQRYTPRTKASRWSRINREAAERLTSAGRMRRAGLVEVERAKANGRWDAAYEGSRSAAIPDDLQRELDARPAAMAFFATLNSQNRYAILYRLQDATKPETRARRLEKFVGMLERGETIYPASRART